VRDRRRLLGEPGESLEVAHAEDTRPDHRTGLLLHGTADWRAKPKTNAIDLAAALLEAKHPTSG
jgi:hypothetical protein